ncbi:tryptophan--tRNA ligase, mitochondrial-like [Musca domestica]|uniref:tryptophan--tRNA ligase n=1 Tax=Musca domestica TaxID=7370 RepID=A0ABM3VKL6_MUSDO|nr:tryptophan--tRNA ligase, mitochondrial-like [Musca domestica]XP_058986339.1 tryptophan--tRNA ligase, mitochondrial-like [Musca domestica]
MNCNKIMRSLTWLRAKSLRLNLRSLSTQTTMKSMDSTPTMEEEKENLKYPRKIFSGIQPTGQLHLGNYLGAVQKWTQLQNSGDDVTYCIVDMHSITIPQNPAVLRENIFEMAATMLACGLDPQKSTIFVQSSVQEHTELGWILSCLCTMPRLGHLPQYKEKSRTVKDVPLGLYVYPVLQAADIMLYKATHVPVGEDQLQHIQLTQHLSRIFNTKFGQTFPICHAMIDNHDAARIRSLRNPAKKMSKSDLDTKATINIRDAPEVIVEKIKKAVTDFTSDVTYEPEARPGVSNLVVIHSMVSGTPIEKVVEEARAIDTGRYKLRVAEAVVEHLKPIRLAIDEHLAQKNDLIHLLESGAERARQVAQQNIVEVKEKMGLGIYRNVPQYIDMSAELLNALPKDKKKPKASDKETETPIVPKQKLRVEKKSAPQNLAPTFKLDESLASPPSPSVAKKAQ